MKRRILTYTLLSMLLITLGSTSLTAEKLNVPETATMILDNGLKVIAIEHHEQPVVALRLLIKAGTVFDPDYKEGVANLTAGLLRKGTATRDANQISKEIDFVGGSLSAASGRDATFATCSILSKHFDIGLDLLSDITLNPTFADDEIDRLSRQLMAALVQQKDDPNSVVAEQYAHFLFGDHPYGKPENGTIETVSEIERADIVAFWEKYFIPNNSVLFVAGDIEPKSIFKKVEEKFGGWQKGELPDYNFPPAKQPESTRIILINKPDVVQSSIKIGHIGIDRYNPDIFSCRVLNYILGGGGFVSRLMKDIRADRGLTYDINSRFSYSRFPGDFTVTTFTKNDSTVNAILGTIEHLRGIRKEVVQKEELQETISFYSGYFPLQFETPSQIASQMQVAELYDLGEDYLPNYIENIAAVTADDVLKAAQNYIHPDRLLIVVVGKGDDIRDALKEIAPVTEIDISDI